MPRVRRVPTRLGTDWQMLRRLIAERARQVVPLLMGVDANGTIGCETSSAVAPTRAAPQTDNGTGLHEALVQAGLAAANTFLQSDTSSCGTTWWSAIPARRLRTDSVAVPESWLPCVTSAGAGPVIDLCAPRLDHVAGVVRLRFAPSLCAFASLCSLGKHLHRALVGQRSATRRCPMTL